MADGAERINIFVFLTCFAFYLPYIVPIFKSMFNMSSNNANSKINTVNM